MDSSKIGSGFNWTQTSMTGATPGRPQATPAPAAETAAAAPHDQVDVSAAVSTPAPTAQVTTGLADGGPPKGSVNFGHKEVAPRNLPPETLLADDSMFAAVGASSSAGGAHPTSGLGVLAQLEEVQAIDQSRGSNPFAGLHLVGVNNAAEFLADPSKMYLGV